MATAWPSPVGNPMALVYALVFGSVAAFGLTAVYGLVWAVRNRQLERFARGATSIFDAEEPVGEMTDRFPRGDRGGPDRVREEVEDG